MYSSLKLGAAFAALTLLPCGANAAAQSTAGSVEPEASAALDKMGAALRGLNSFSTQADVTTEQVLTTGQKVQHGGTLELQVRRPDGFKIVAKSDRQHRELYYDGKSLTLYAPRLGLYGSVTAPATIGATINQAKDTYDIEIPLADLFSFGVDPSIKARITSGFAVGTETIRGTLCTHYAFRQPMADWELWIRTEGTALPCKLVITTTDDPSRPQYTAVLNLSARPAPAGSFKFTPPPGAHRIDVAAVADQAK
jgi:hypothetical protein